MINLYQLKNVGVPLDNHYQLLERIGGGGFSEVWLAKDLRSQVQVALKVYSSVQEMDEEGIKMFRKEFSLVCNLNHTNILKPFTFDIFNGCPYIVLPYCERGSMAKYVGKLQEEELWDFAGQVAAGLAYMHKHQIIHQDIKPGNVLINGDGQLMITDFGISTGIRKTMRRSKSSDDSARDGTIAYMSYECLKDSPVNAMARDIWALGASLYELAMGDVPFGDYGGLTQKAKKGNVSMDSANLSSSMKNLIRKCLSLEPWDRPSAEDIVNIVASHKTGSQRHIDIPVNMKKVAMTVAGVVAITFSIVFLLKWTNNDYKPKTEVVAMANKNPNDSVYMDLVAKANNAINKEKRKTDIENRDVENLCAAAKIYKDAAGVEVSDSIKAQGDKMWSAAQTVIDETYIFLYNKGVEYSNIDATDAANGFWKKSLPLKDYVSNGVTSKLKKKKAARKVVPTNKKEHSPTPSLAKSPSPNKTASESGDTNIPIMSIDRKKLTKTDN